MTSVQAVILFDDECVLCNRFAQWIIKNDQSGYFKFLSLRSKKTEELFLSDCFRKKADPGSVVLIEGNIIYTQSDAALKIISKLDGIKKYTYYLLKIIPKVLRNIVYKWIARNRYSWFGKTDKCTLDKSRLIEFGE